MPDPPTPPHARIYRDRKALETARQEAVARAKVWVKVQKDMMEKRGMDGNIDISGLNAPPPMGARDDAGGMVSGEHGVGGWGCEHPPTYGGP